MPTLIVKPIDMDAPGSYAARRKVRTALRHSRDAISRLEGMRAQLAALEEAASKGNTEAAASASVLQQEVLMRSGEIMDATAELEELVISQARTDDGSPVEDVLALISGNAFDRLLAAMLGQSPVPSESSDS